MWRSRYAKPAGPAGGATPPHVGATGGEPHGEFKAGHFDLIVSTVSAPLDFSAYLSLLKTDGALVNVGAPEEPVSLTAFTLIVGRRTLAGSATTI